MSADLLKVAGFRSATKIVDLFLRATHFAEKKYLRKGRRF